MTTVLPTILIIIPLYLRHIVFADVPYLLAESDVVEIKNGISSVFCSAHSLKMTSNFNAVQLNSSTGINTEMKSIKLKKSMALPDDTLEYWGFYLLKGAIVNLKVCSHYEGARILVVRGEKNLRTCGLMDGSFPKFGAKMDREYKQVKVMFESGLDPEDGTTTVKDNINNEIEYSEIEDNNLGVEDKNDEEVHDYKDVGANLQFELQRDDGFVELNRSKRDAEHLLDTKIGHGGNAINFTDAQSDESSDSSFETSLLTCYNGKILLTEAFPPSHLCTGFHYLENGDRMETIHSIVSDGYYYYIFYSDNDYVTNDIFVIFDIQKPTLIYPSLSETKFCTNKTLCKFSLPFWSDETVIVEVPMKEGIVNEQNDTVLISTCHPRISEEWNADKNGPASQKDSQNYDGPPGMDPDGVIESNWEEVVDNFDDMNLKEELLRGIYAYGFEKPSAIQQRAIMPCVKGHDVIAQAQSGTGKTATFSISILQQIDTSIRDCQALILAPTRELAQQIQKVVIALGDFMSAQCHACIGGTNVREDMRKLETGMHVVVGTPGRVYDMISRRALRTNCIKMFVLDEADEMLSRGFKDQIHDVFKMLNVDVQVILLSATMPNDVLDVTKSFMRNPVQILVKKEELTLEGIKQFFVYVEREEWKLETLCDLYDTLSITQAVIFCNTRRKVDILTENMHKRDFTVSAMHGDMEQRERDVIMRQFRSGSSRVLITTDLLARGIDVQQVSLVINYDLPSNRENYIHRIGRGGRFGRKGVAINFVTEDDKRILKDIEQFYNTHIDEMPMNVADLI
ncbi:hypothetical protein FQR65_LT02275 [Abscondita terminalis]|nr:hypothetical protein FQR65_LT02275 [Abscondita terminalis]